MREPSVCAAFAAEILTDLGVRFALAGALAAERYRSQPLRIRGKGDKIDVLFAILEYQLGAIEPAVDNVLAIEDVIIHKLIAWRRKDRDDIDSILIKGDPYDDEYVRYWAGQWEVLDRWEEAIRARP